MKKVVVLLCCALVIPATARRNRDKKYDCSEKVNKAIERYEKGRYSEVKTILDEVHYNCTGHRVIDTALYYLGMSYLKAKQGIEAQNEFERLLQSFPNSPFADEVRFRIGQSIYLQSTPYNRDQSETRQAIRSFGDYLSLYPNSPFADSVSHYLEKCHDKLAHREFDIARFYHKIEEFDAAIIYYRSTIQEYPESRYIPEAKVFLAGALIATNRTSEAREVLDDLLSGGYTDEIARRSRLLETKLESKAN